MSGLESHPGILLEKHLLGVDERIAKFCEDMKTHGELCKVARLTALTHDLGKTTGYFQQHLKGQRVNSSLSSHALLSAVIAVWHVAKDLPLQWKLPLFIAVRSHHANPTSLSEMIDAGPKHDWKYLEKQADAINIDQFKALLSAIKLEIPITYKLLPSFDDFRHNFSWPALDEKEKKGISLYFTTNLLLGMLVDADIRAVIGMPANEKRPEIPEDIVDRYIEKLPKNSPIDPLRQDFYKTVISNIQKFGIENKFFSLTAPTGIGKTLAGFSAAVQLRSKLQKETGRLPRIIYVLPFTSIIDQNFEVIKRVFKNAMLPEDILLKHHFRTNPSRTFGFKIEDIWGAFGENRILKIRNAEELLRQYKKVHN
ncbi:MAG: CRISPR-associated endonuclease Cas3'', partial [Candidatus Aminicenantes bacterium]|nr:CRISPR-associated endonuclease Cas3'' [Candidatus Aminicenantes bacterium]